MEQIDKEGLDFLEKLYHDIRKSPNLNIGQIMKERLSSKNDYESYKKLIRYALRKEEQHKKIWGKDKELLKKLYFDKYVIKEEDISDNYFKSREKILFEQGYGIIEYNEKTKKQEKQLIIKEQQISLENWIEYLMSDDALYPNWAKYWLFQGMLKIGNIDKENHKFSRRRKDTTAPFVLLDREALALCYDTVLKKISGKENLENELNQLINRGDFAKIYLYHILKLDKLRRERGNLNKEGIWKKYTRGSNPEILVNDIKHYATGWCTAGIETATLQLRQGDFYVYFSLDEKQEPKIPRIAIRSEDDKIAEIRGVGPDQNMESEMEDVLEKKLKEFPDKDEYYEKVSDTKSLTYIYNEKYKKNIEFTVEELRFLYELDKEIKGFGYQRDPRIGEIIYNNDMRTDLSKIFNCSKDEVSLTEEEALSGRTIKYHHGSIYSSAIKIRQWMLPEEVGGNLILSNVEEIEIGSMSKKVRGTLNLSKIKKIKRGMLPEEVNGNLFLNSIEEIEIGSMPKKVGEDLYLSKLKVLKKGMLPEEIDGDLYLNNIEVIEYGAIPKKIGGSIYLNNGEVIEPRITSKTVSENFDLPKAKRIDERILSKEITGVSLEDVGSIDLVYDYNVKVR